MASVDMSLYEDTPLVITKRDDLEILAYRSKEDKTKAIIFMNGSPIDWTPYLQSQMDAGLIKKK